MLREYIYCRVGRVNRSSPAGRSPDATAGFSGSSPGAAHPVPLYLVWLGRVWLWWLESGRCALTDAAYLLPHPSSLVEVRLGRREQTPSTPLVHIPPSWSGLSRIVFLNPLPALLRRANVQLARVSSFG